MAEYKKDSGDGCFIWIVVILIAMHSCGGKSTEELTKEINRLKNRIDKLENNLKNKQDGNK